MKNDLILNEGYNNPKLIFDKGNGNKIVVKNKFLYDLSYSSGVIFLGHNHYIFKHSLKECINKKISIFSNPNIYAYKLAKTIKSFFSNFNKVIFCSTGSESVIKALRICRAVSKKNIVVCVVGSWHGSVDQTLFFPKTDLSPVPISSGLKEVDKKNILFIPYNDIDESRKILNKFKNNINCVLIEPVTASLPNKSVGLYLKFLESYCKKEKIILIFDEIVSAFRTKKGSVQAQFDIKPDITLIGKILGGGFPVGAIGLSKNIFNKINKLKTPVFFGGTFSANTFSMLVGNNVITYIKNNLKLVDRLIKNCEIFENKVNSFIAKNNIDSKVYRFDTIVRVVFSRNEIHNRIQRDFLEKKQSQKKERFVKFLLKKNIYYPKNGIILLSLANNSQKDLKYIIKIFCIGLNKYFRINK
jgi:glutamate-1-semialdehyde 2,1-aminomutase